jgi:secreted PhoX family phosphatase
MYIVSKTTKSLFIFDLDKLTWEKSSTKKGVFSDQPDQIKFINGGTDGLFYFTEDGGSTCGVHARNKVGQYVTIFESNGTFYKSETTGLAFSPDKKHMYVAFQIKGDVYDITRDDEKPFDGDIMDIKYHNAPESFK